MVTSENAAVAAATDKAGVLRNYFCPKCGAVGDVRWVRPVTQQEMDTAYAKDSAAREKYDAEREAERQKAKNRGRDYFGWLRRYYSPVPDEWWGPAHEGLEYGEHLACTCPRCSHSWRDAVLAATADSPIYDELAAS